MGNVSRDLHFAGVVLQVLIEAKVGMNWDVQVQAFKSAVQLGNACENFKFFSVLLHQ